MIKAAVLEVFPRFSIDFEGRVNTFYRDILGLVTIGIGCLCDTVEGAMALPMVRADGTPAMPSEIAKAWQDVKANANPRMHWKYAIPFNHGLRLTDEGVDALCRERLLRDMVPGMVRAFPQWTDFPADAQLACLSIAWACGSGWPGKFPLCKAALNSGDFRAAAIHGKIKETAPDGTYNAGVVPRNRANKYLFLAAAEADSPTAPEGYSETVHYRPLTPEGTIRLA